MTRKLQAGLMFIWLLIAISCSKENDSNPISGASSRALTSSSDDESVADGAVSPANFSGAWVLHWSWGCGVKSSTSIFFNSNGTFSDGLGEAGRWTQNSAKNILLFNFNSRGDYWSGRPASGNVNGIMADFPSVGCFSLTRTTPNPNEKITKGQTAPPGK
jgi:hypothetical protein